MTHSKWTAILISAIGLALTCAQADSGGYEHGNGADPHRFDTGSAWYLGPRRDVRVCFKKEKEFPASESQVKEAIDFGFSTWEIYHSRKVQRRQPQLDPTFKRVLIPKCDGTEDLAFYLGSMNDRIAKARSNYENPLAFAERESFRPDRGWGKGFIWIGASSLVNWGDIRNLKGILLHELGHVFGCSHTAFTIMDSGIDKHLTHLTREPENGFAVRHLDRIDQERELVVNPMELFSVTGRLDIPYADEENYKAFEKLVGRPRSGEVQATLRKIGPEVPGESPFELVYKDKTSEASFRIKYLDSPAIFWNSQDTFVFKGCIQAGGKRMCDQELGAPSNVIEGRITNSRQERLRVTLSRNAASGSAAPARFTISLVTEDGGVSLFKSEIQ
jgi:hypothetical protein